MKNLTKSGFAGIASAVILAAAALVPSANAQIALNFGNFTINAQGYSADNFSGVGGAPGGLVVPGSGGELEDTWGIFQIKTIESSGLTLFADNFGTEYWGLIYGSYDVSSDFLTDPAQAQFTSKGLTIDVYKHTVNDGPTEAVWTTVADNSIGGRTGFNTYTGITNAAALGDTVTKVFSASLNYTSLSTYTYATGATFTTGNLGVTFNTLFTFAPGSVLSALNYTATGLTSEPPFGWSDKFSSKIDGAVVPVPEPSTYGLMAAGALVGLVAFRRMKVRASAV